MKNFLIILLIIVLSSCSAAQKTGKGIKQSEVRGWNILTDIPEEGKEIIETAKQYDVNHLQLSHHIIMDLKDARIPEKANLANSHITMAHQEGIKEVLVWDHALYNLEYYPNRFKTEEGLINLDNPDFWKWFKQDYREMLELLPGVNGIILTFIETGARVEEQHSEELNTPGEKLAKLVNTIAEVIIEEQGNSLYIRTFAYNQTEYNNVLECIELLENDEVRLMMKETPHDFFLYHPNNPLIGKINRPTLVEFDLGNEFNGQSLIANTYPEYVFERWKDFEKRPNVIGYVARMDRYKTSKIIGKPSEILAEALFKSSEMDSPQPIYDSFLIRRYGDEAAPELKKAFQLMNDVVRSTFYTLGLNTENHSALDFNYRSIYTRHVSGRWMENPMVYIGHGLNKKFHYWKDIVNHLAPARYKGSSRLNLLEIPEVLEAGWIQEEELMNQDYLDDIVIEKDFGVGLAQKALSHIENAQPSLDNKDYMSLYESFYRTLIAAKLRRSIAKAFYGYRIYARGEDFRNKELERTIKQGLTEAREMIPLIEAMQNVPEGQWNYYNDADRAHRYIEKITQNGWEDYGNVVFKESRNILTIGDSNGASDHGWVVQLKKLLPNDSIYNVSIPGNTIGFNNLDNPNLNTLANLDKYLAQTLKRSGNLDKIVILLGTNDAKAVFHERQDEVIEKLATLLKKIDHYDFPDKKPAILVVSPPPYGPDTVLADKYKGGDSRVSYFAEKFQEIAQKHDVEYLNIYKILKNDFMSFSEDGVHLDAEGQRIIAKAIKGKLK